MNPLPINDEPGPLCSSDALSTKALGNVAKLGSPPSCFPCQQLVYLAGKDTADAKRISLTTIYSWPRC